MDQTPGDRRPDRAAPAGDRQALADPVRGYRDRLARMVELRIDAGVGPGSTPRTSSRRRSSTSPATWTPTCADPKLPPLLWLRLLVGRRLTTLHRQHLGTKMRDAGPGDLALPRGAARGQLGRAGLDAAGPAHLAHPGGPARRAAAAGPGGAQQPRPDRPRGARAAALRAAQPRRDGRGAGDQRGGRGQAVLPCPEAAQGRAGGDAGRLREGL